ncbi:Hsp33 family molecular chaperone HslO [Chondromyces apiculatus]|uniref:Chaperonin (Heat shock protein 33) n=1 Tax=Chondromyces apiculatus DSM 436 TaxID=1192034 RepID=A0A017SZZ8_9BACT|nr:Hsp33 family molecular chaperone HslO [Chondromyces apiculatus]EYF02534.1 Chaperonin (heat shock protein 33) [Chondromyces apiculatus DSM 436]
MSEPSDTVVRAITQDGAFRVITALTTATVRGTVAAQAATGNTAQRLGELLTGAILVREAMAPTLRVQVIVKGAGQGSLVADAHPDGTTRGLVNLGKGSEVAIGEGSLIQVMRTLPNGALQQGVVELPREGRISQGLMAYMQESEQVVTMVSVATLLDEQGVGRSGGVLVQLLPEVERGPLMVMTERLREFERLDEVLADPQVTADKLLEEVLYGMPFTRLESSALSYACRCSQLRVVAALASLPRSDIEEMVAEGQVLDIACDYCRKAYQVAPGALKTLLTES